MQDEKKETIESEMQCVVDEPIKVCDSNGTEVSYSNLESTQKENLLSELLFQSALQNINEQQVVQSMIDVALLSNYIFGKL